MVEDSKRFLNKRKELKLYLIGFNEDGTIKAKTYPPDFIVGNEDCQTIIKTTYNECNFLINFIS